MLNVLVARSMSQKKFVRNYVALMSGLMRLTDTELDILVIIVWKFYIKEASGVLELARRIAVLSPDGRGLIREEFEKQTKRPMSIQNFNNYIKALKDKGAIIKTGEQEKVTILQGALDGRQHLPLNFAVGCVLTQVIDPQQRLVQRAEPLLARGRSGRIGKRLEAHALLIERVTCKASGLVIADQSEEADIGAQTVGVRGHRAGATDEGSRHQGGHHDRRVFLRHADGIASDVLIYDEIANHGDTHADQLSEQ